MSRFINPYSFLPLSDRKKLSSRGEEQLTGYIGYQLVTKSSIFVPNISSDSAFSYVHTKNEKGDDEDPENKHKLLDFFSLNKLNLEETYDEVYFEPQIPGSEIRGEIRSIYETLTASCVSQINEDVIIGKRTVEHFLPGILKRDKDSYMLFSAKDTILRDDSNFSKRKFEDKTLPADGTSVSVTLRPNGRKAKMNVVSLSGNIKGYIIKGEQGPKLTPNGFIKNNKCPNCIMNKSCDKKRCWSAEKHSAHVFVPYEDHEEEKKQYHVTELEVKNIQYVIKQYQETKENAYKEYENTYKKFVNRKVDELPVYYSIISSGHIIMSPACITREVYNNNVKKVLGEFNKCTPDNHEDKKICPACSLFGLVNPGGFSKGSKVRFTDLKLMNKDSYNGEYGACYDKDLYIMPELANPKISNTDFYLVKPVDPEGEVWFWTYDYYTVKRPDGTIIVKEYTPTISGRKFYWHGKKITGYTHKTKRNKTVRTVKEGICFEGKVYFDGISQNQLEQLAFILNYTADEKRGFKIGSGKPIGLGSVCLKITEIKTRTFNGIYKEEPYNVQNTEWERLDFDDNIKNGFDSITKFLSDEDVKLVHYPGIYSESDEGYAWFVNNKSYHKLNTWRVGENQLKMGDNKPDRSPRARIQTEIIQHIDRPEINKYLNDTTIDGNRGHIKVHNSKGNPTWKNRNSQGE